MILKNFIQTVLNHNNIISNMLSHIKLGIDASKTFKKILPNTDFEAYLFGGAVRDTLNKKEISDFDFYIYLPENSNKISHRKEVLQIKNQLMSKFKSVREVLDLKIDGYLNNDIIAVIKIEDPTLPYPVDLVFGSIPFTSFLDIGTDFNFCKIGMDLNSFRILKDENYSKDLKNKTISFNNIFMTLEGVKFSLKERLPKLLLKYPDFKFDVYPNNYLSFIESYLNEELKISNEKKFLSTTLKEPKKSKIVSI